MSKINGAVPLRKICILGASNANTKHSYSKKLNIEGYIISNKGIGGTSSLMSLIQDSQFNCIEESDIIIFDYFTSDSSQFFGGKYSPKSVKETLKAFLNKVKDCDKKVLFLLIHGHNIRLENKRNPILRIYQDLIKRYHVAYIDVWELLLKHSSCCLRMKKWYDVSDGIFIQNHLNEKAMDILALSIKEKIEGEKVYVPKKK
jgi:hypothetical protein